MKRNGPRPDAPPSGTRPELLVDARTRRILEANSAAARAYGYPPAKLAGLPVTEVWPAAPQALSEIDDVAAGLRLARQQRRDGRPLDLAVEIHHAAGALTVVAKPVSDRAFTLALMESQSRFLEQIAAGASLDELLGSLVLAIERLSSDMLGSVLLLSDDGWHVRHGAAPHLPVAYWSALEGQRIGPQAGSCGTAMYRRKAVIVADIERDPLWRPWRELAVKHGLRACWSIPILSRHGQVLGSFALYYRDVREPGEREMHLVQLAAELAAIAIERDAADRRLAGATPAAGAAAHQRLSAREMQIVRMLAHGDPVKRIASSLRISVSTVYAHRASIFEKLGVASNVELSRYAVRHQLVG